MRRPEQLCPARKSPLSADPHLNADLNKAFTLRQPPRRFKPPEPLSAMTRTMLLAYLKCVLFLRQAPTLRLVESGLDREEDKTKPRVTAASSALLKVR